MTEAAVEAALKELRKDEGNKRCFVCSERGPNYVDMDHNAFVCTTCAGIMREFTFKLKGLSMATFSANEVKALKASNCNTGANKIYLARFSDDRPKPGDKDRIRTFIKEVFVSKRYAERKKKEEADDSDDEKAHKSTTRKKSESVSSDHGEDSKKKPVKVSITKDRKGADEKKAVPKPIVQASTPIVKPENNDLLDMDFGFSSAPPQTAKMAPVRSTADSSFDDPFDDFVSASTPSASIAPVAPAPAKPVDPFDFGDFSSVLPTNTNVNSSRSQVPSNNGNLFASPASPQAFPVTPQASMPFVQSHVQQPQVQQSQMPMFQPFGNQAMPVFTPEMLQQMQNNPQMMQMMMQMMQQQMMMQNGGMQWQPQQQPAVSQYVQQSAQPVNAAFPSMQAGTVNPKNPFVTLNSASVKPPVEDIFGAFS